MQKLFPLQARIPHEREKEICEPLDDDDIAVPPSENMDQHLEFFVCIEPPPKTPERRTTTLSCGPIARRRRSRRNVQTVRNTLPLWEHEIQPLSFDM